MVRCNAEEGPAKRWHDASSTTSIYCCSPSSATHVLQIVSMQSHTTSPVSVSRPLAALSRPSTDIQHSPWQVQHTALLTAATRPSTGASQLISLNHKLQTGAMALNSIKHASANRQAHIYTAFKHSKTSPESQEAHQQMVQAYCKQLSYKLYPHPSMLQYQLYAYGKHSQVATPTDTWH